MSPYVNSWDCRLHSCGVEMGTGVYCGYITVEALQLYFFRFQIKFLRYRNANDMNDWLEAAFLDIQDATITIDL